MSNTTANQVLKTIEKMLEEGFIFKDVRVFENPYTNSIDAVAFLSRDFTTVSIDSNGRIFELNQPD